LELAEADPSPLIDIRPPTELMLVPVKRALFDWQGPRVIPAVSVVEPNPFAAPPGTFTFSALAAPPPSVIAPPVEPQVLDDHPEQIVFEASSSITPPLDASVSDQRVIGPPLVRKLMLAAVRTLRLDFNTSPLFAPVTVMFAPAVRSLDAPVPVNRILPTAVKLAVVLTPAQVTVRSPATLTAPPEFVNSPDPPQFSVRALPAVALLTAAETVMAPALSI
jgi:hypothetical protein